MTTAALDGTATVLEVNTLVANAINAIAGSTVASIVGNQVVVTAPVAGTALPTITITSTVDGDVTEAAVTAQANVVGSAAVPAVEAAVFDLSDDGFTNITTSAVGGENVTLNADQSITSTDALGT